MTNWRPEDWEDGKVYDTEKKGGISDAEIFEAGADAMLQSLLSCGLKVVNLSIEHQGRGTIVFIPDQKPPDGCNSEES